MRRRERLARIQELDRYADWLTEHDPREFLQYHYKRTGALDALAPYFTTMDFIKFTLLLIAGLLFGAGVTLAFLYL